MASTTVKVDIKKMVDWGNPKEVRTQRGVRILRKAKATQSFWDIWNAAKSDLKSAGISLSKTQAGEWEVCWWQELSKKQKEKIKEEIESSWKEDFDGEIPCPDGLSYLPYQKAGVAYSMSRRNVLIGDEMGLGKTIQAIGVASADETVKQVVIVCPSSLRLNWQREWKKWFARGGTTHVVVGGKASAWKKAECIIINYDVVSKHRKRIDELDIDLLIVDECHYLKNPKTARTKACIGNKKLEKDGIKSRRKVFLSGTPICNRPVELWPLVEVLDPDGLGANFFSFAKRYCGAAKVYAGGRSFWDFSGATNLSELQELLRRKCMIRRLKADVLKELPAKQRQVIEIPSDGEPSVASELEKAANQEDRIAELEAEKILSKASDNPEDYKKAVEALNSYKQFMFTEMARERKEAALAKVPHVIEHLESALENGPVVCFGHHKKVVEQICSHFEGAVSVTGETSIKDRQEAVDKFQRGDARLFVGNIQAAGVGLTLTKSSHVVFAELDWVPGNITQAEDRCHRIGQESSVLVQHIVFENSIDATMAKTIMDKQDVIDKALDSDLEIEVPSAKKRTAKTISISRKKIEELACKLTESQQEAIKEGLSVLAAHCDGAFSEDGMGFNKCDAQIGRSLAMQKNLTPKQLAIGLALVVKYGKKQLPESLVNEAKGA